MPLFKPTISAGFLVLQHKEIWFAILAYAGATMLVRGVTSRMSGEKVGSFSYILGSFIIQTLFLPPLVGLWTPLLAGAGHASAMSVITEFYLPLLGLAGLTAGGVMIVSMIPGIGRLLATTSGLGEFIVAIVTFRYMARVILGVYVANDKLAGNIFPGTSETIKYVLVALVFTGVHAIVLKVWATETSRYKYESEQKQESVGFFTGPTIGVTAGLLPFFMYTQWVRMAIGV